MAGFDNDVIYGTNIDFTGTNPVSGQINQDGELLVGSSVAPFIRSYVPTGSNNLTIIVGQGTLDFSLSGPITPSSYTNKGVLIGQGSNPIQAVTPATAGTIFQSLGAASNPGWSTATYPSTAGTSGKVLISDGTNIVSSTPTFPNSSASTGKFIISDGTNWVASTPTIANAAGTAGKVLVSDGTNFITSTPTFPNASATSGKFIRSDGTNWIASTPTLPTSAGTSGKVLMSDATNYVESTATFPSTASGTGTILRANGTNWVATTATYPATTTANQFLYSSADNTVAGLTNGTNGQVIIAATSAVPAFATLGSTGGSLAYTTGTNSLSIDLASFVQSVNYTPALSFGGGSTGITYTTQLGRYTRLCNVVFFEATIVLSAKGSSTGNAAISIPVNTINSSVGKFICAMEATATMPASCTFFIGECGTPNTAVVSLVGCGGSTITNLTDANFGATTTVRVSGWYLAA